MEQHFKFINSGSLIQIFPITKEAKEWLEDNCETESYQWLGNSLCVEPRYFDAIYEGMQQEFGAEVN